MRLGSGPHTKEVDAAYAGGPHTKEVDAVYAGKKTFPARTTSLTL